MITEIVDDFARAYVYAKAAHSGQKRLDGSPYIGHPLAVVGALCEAGRGADTALLCAALLHDVVEDTAATQEYVCMCFGDDVADLVERVTNKPGKNRAEKHKNTYPRIQENNRARLLKYADRLANIRSCCSEWMRTGKKGMFAMYYREADGFMAALKVPNSELTDSEKYLIREINCLLATEGC